MMPPIEDAPSWGQAFEELALRIRAVRQRHELTQQEFAKRLGVSRSHLSEVEVSRAKPAADILIGIPRAFPEISAEWLLTGAGPMTQGTAAGDQDEGGVSELAARTAVSVVDLINQKRKNQRGVALSNDEVSTLLLLLPQVFRTTYFAARRRAGVSHNEAVRAASEKATVVGKEIAKP